jgi:FKBP-type peptidyl-prolyl cis-trans isomerase (trigger factor)
VANNQQILDQRIPNVAVLNQLKSNLSQSMIASSSQENLQPAASKQAMTGLHSSIPNNITP